jgi:hypothetical protein
MPRKPASGGSPRNRKKSTPSPEISTEYQFDTLTESEKALQRAGWKPTLLDDFAEFRRIHNITPEIIAQKRAEGFEIADIVSLEATSIHGDVLETSRLRGSFHSLAVSEDQLGLVKELEAARRENARLKGDAIVLPVSKSQIVDLFCWCKDNMAWLIVGMLGVSLIWVVFFKSAPTPHQAPTPTVTQKTQR